MRFSPLKKVQVCTLLFFNIYLYPLAGGVCWVRLFVPLRFFGMHSHIVVVLFVGNKHTVS